MHEVLRLVTVGLIRSLHCCSDFSRDASTAKRGNRPSGSAHAQTRISLGFSLKRRTLWNSPKDHLGSGGIFRILFAGPGARLFRVEDDGPMGIPNNGAFYFALPTKP